MKILLDCLQRFVEIENLDETEWYTCNNCKKRQPSTKKFWILQLPNVSLLITFWGFKTMINTSGCFSYLRHSFFFNKITVGYLITTNLHSVKDTLLKVLIWMVLKQCLYTKCYAFVFQVLCLHLKRFRYTPHGRTKVDTFVRFPIEELNMNSYLLSLPGQVSII